MKNIKPGFVYFFGSLGGLLFGIDSGIIGGALSPIKQSLPGGMTSVQEGFMTSSVLWGSAITALIVGKLSDKFGRKKLLLAAAVVFTAGAIGCMFAQDYTTLLLVRVLLGAGIGIASASVPAYLAELSPATKRGTIATLFQFMIVTGLLSAYIIDYAFLPFKNVFGDGFTNWQLMLGFAAIPAIILFFGSILIPESPRFLVKEGRVDEAKAILLNLRSNDTAVVATELSEIQEIANEPQGGFKDLLTIGRKGLIAACGLAILQQFVGINAAFYYGPKLAAGIMPSDATAGSVEALQHDQSIAIIFGVVNIVATFVTVLVMQKFANKALLYAGAAMMGLFSFILAGVGFLGDLSSLGVVGIVFVSLYIVGFAFSWGPIIWNTIGEIFPLSVRGIGASIATFANWASNGLMMTLFPIIIAENATTGESHVERGFLVFGIFCIVAIFFTKFFVPETKGKSLEEIEEQFRHGSK
jgi:sugar porter (SP) family MFS transporter